MLSVSGRQAGRQANELDGGVLQDGSSIKLVDDGRLGAAIVRRRRRRRSILQQPDVATFVVYETRVVVALVEVLEDGGKDLRVLLGQADALVVGLEELAAAAGSEERGETEDLFVGGEETLLGADTEGDDGRSQIAGRESSSAISY